MRSLVLIGHGSHLNSESAGAVYRYAELLRERGLFDEVVEGYWKEEPSLRQVLRTCRYTDVTVIPMFISEGYFTETVIPRELGLGHQGPVPPEGIARVLGGKTVRYTLPYGVHASMSDVILARAHEALPDANAQDTALVIIGHGTTRNENSNRVIHQNAERLRAAGLFAEVHALFLDEDPRLSTWTDVVRSPRVVMVPFFASEGWHTLETIPEDLGLTGEVTTFGAQTVYYSKPTGTHAMVADVVLNLAEGARGQSLQGGDVDAHHAQAWDTFMRLAQGGVRLGEAVITPQAGVFELRHMLDEGRGNAGLHTVVTPEGVRDVVREDEGGHHRPVHTLRNLPRGWRAVLSAEDLPRAVHYLYPAVVEESFACHTHALHTTPWATTARRQTGIYTKVQSATAEQVEAAARDVCSRCLKTRLWASQKLDSTVFDGVPGGIPCPEACTLLVAEVRERMSAKAGGGHHH
ncbi:DR2241 family protein [Deinococcus maricopensis]|uniref:Cobalamin (Vitamin B12) biosynthesis CbiX protein n=1 Tax=Deinococcus maricopensis (strain DSM 21211 / LMG 22137 / NRRL B-23946 / LB-34) TaxID=709986 RepID=E8U4F0_DEIML|nr:DR2241 family protein [Deinococcus maricopensis]ADV68815.1 cobalamin (vitamin B12) biosynthesis CbiX protein [Deinococcus maricopensis DSM 21211]